MSKRTFKQAFNAVFHSNETFEDFCSLDINSEIEEFSIRSRTVYKTSSKLKKYLRFIDKVLLSHLQNNERVVHSYIKDRSPLTAIQEHAKNKYFFITDIKEFFSNITTDNVNKILARDQGLMPISDFESFIPIIVKFTTFGGSIPVGFVTSPKISNSFLLEFDSELEQFCLKNDFTYTRYSDDIIISSGSPDTFDGLTEEIQGLLQKHASETLTLNKKKTRKTHIGNKIKILGLVITLDGGITIDKKYKKILESLLHFYINDKSKYQDILNKELNGKERSLFGLLQYAKSVDPKYLDKLQRKYGVYALSALMEDRRDE